MPKRILAQRKGRGKSNVFKSRRKSIPELNYSMMEGISEIQHFRHSPGIFVPIMNLGYGFLRGIYSAYIGQKIYKDPISIDPNVINIVKLADIPIGSKVCLIEKRPDGPIGYLKSAGSEGLIINKSNRFVSVKLKSGIIREFANNCRATIGSVAAFGKTEQPFLKAGRRYHKLKRSIGTYRTVRGVAMGAVSHPHGGGDHQHVGRPSTVKFGTPPGRKVGRFSPRPKRLKKNYK